MPRISPFHAVRPRPEQVGRVVGLPHDVDSREEAIRLSRDNPSSFLHVVHAEADVPEPLVEGDARVPAQAAKAFKRLLDEGVFVRDDAARVFVYRQSGEVAGEFHSQTGLLCCVDLRDYDEGRIKKHEKTLSAKEDRHVAHLLAVRAHAAPVLLACRDDERIKSLLREHTSRAPLYDFTDAIRHEVWAVEDGSAFVEAFGRLDGAYIADGHHRSAAASRVASTLREERGAGRGDLECDRYLVALFPASELKILPFHRAIRDLRGLTPAQFLDALARVADIADASTPEPGGAGTVGVRIKGVPGWRRATFHADRVDRDDPVRSLDVSLLADLVLEPILGVTDPRSDPRIECVPGARGVGELERMLDEGEAEVVFTLHPTAIGQLLSVADANKTMPPKSTCFEPKIRPGLLVHMLD
ncbi:MAG: DUF1015 domain-containing protein [Phycisphaeraceae bacterium]|nr:DUF1015 domain-containing protein [Phycisphaeraceae bacterium]